MRTLDKYKDNLKAMTLDGGILYFSYGAPIAFEAFRGHVGIWANEAYEKYSPTTTKHLNYVTNKIHTWAEEKKFIELVKKVTAFEIEAGKRYSF